jgi:hypothetical protein
VKVRLGEVKRHRKEVHRMRAADLEHAQREPTRSSGCVRARVSGTETSFAPLWTAN